MRPSEDAITLLKTLYRAGNFGYYWRSDNKQTTWFDCKDPAQLPTTENVYFGIHPTEKRKQGRGTTDTVQLINCLFAEFDSKDFDNDKDAALNHILDLENNPSACIDSGGGFHCYWILSEPVLIDDDNREEIDALQKAWVKTVNGDPGAADLARVLRIPDTWNLKYQPKRKVEKVWLDPENTFTLHELENLIKPENNKPKAPAEPSRIFSAGDWKQSLAYWTDKALDRARPGNRDNTGAWLAAQLRDAGLTPEQAMSSDYPEKVPQTKDRYTRKDWERTVKSIYRGKRREPARNLTAPAPETIQKTKLSEVTGMKVKQAVQVETKQKSTYIETPPELAKDAQIPEDLGKDACTWLDDYIKFSRKWSPRGYDGFHEICGLWLLSTVAARRVGINFGKIRHTGLYFALIARSSLFAKTTTADIAIELMINTGLDFLLAPDSSTPQKFISDMGEKLPSDYASLKDEDKERAKLRLSMAGKRGWFYEEFGQQLSGMMRENGTMADFRGLLRRFDDGAETYEYATIGRGNERIKRPYLALLANMTPADLKPYAKKGSTLWGDGFLARFALVTPPEGELPKDRFPKGTRKIPTELSQTLRRWHERLGVPEVTINLLAEDESEKYIIQPSPITIIELTDEVHEAYYKYFDSLQDIITKLPNQDLDSNYSRFAEKALRMSILFASISESEKVTINHWAKAQAIAERWRSGLHELYNQLNAPTPTDQAENEERVIRVIREKGPVTIREISQTIRLSSSEIRVIVLPLVESGAVIEKKSEKTSRYELA